VYEQEDIEHWRLPFYAAQDPQRNPFQKKTNPHTAENIPQGTRAKVLIVEDERLIAENLRFILEERGYQVIGIVASGEDAFLMTSIMSPDVVLMDIRIHGTVDGIEAAKRIRNLHGRDLPVVFLSAYPAEQFPHLKEMETASFRYLKKPYNQDELVAAIHSLITHP